MKLRSISIRAVTGALILFASSPALAEPSSWQGFYLGLNGAGHSQDVEAGGVVTVDQVTNVTVGGTVFVVPGTFVTTPHDGSHSGANAGGQAGFLIGLGAFHVGLEGDVGFISRTASFDQQFQLPATTLSPGGSTLTVERDLRFSLEWSARLRAGFAAGDNFFYGTGGIAGAQVDARRRDTFVDVGGTVTNPSNGQSRLLPGTGPVITTGSQRRTPIGWTAGIGYERRLGSHLSLGIEARHTDLDDQTFGFANSTRTTTNPGPSVGATPGANNASINSVLKHQSVSIRANWRF